MTLELKDENEPEGPKRAKCKVQSPWGEYEMGVSVISGRRATPQTDRLKRVVLTVGEPRRPQPQAPTNPQVWSGLVRAHFLLHLLAAPTPVSRYSCKGTNPIMGAPSPRPRLNFISPQGRTATGHHTGGTGCQPVNLGRARPLSVSHRV